MTVTATIPLSRAGRHPPQVGRSVLMSRRSLLDPAVTGKLLDRLRNPPATEDPRLGSLTTQEREILDLITDGLSNREIGERLFRAEKTVKNHVSALLAKPQMRRRTQVLTHRPRSG